MFSLEWQRGASTLSCHFSSWQVGLTLSGQDVIQNYQPETRTDITAQTLSKTSKPVRDMTETAAKSDALRVSHPNVHMNAIAEGFLPPLTSVLYNICTAKMNYRCRWKIVTTEMLWHQSNTQKFVEEIFHIYESNSNQSMCCLWGSLASSCNPYL